MIRTIVLVVLLALLPAAPGDARESVPISMEMEKKEKNPRLENRLQDLTSELRCLVCQNQTLAESNSDLAKDLRREIRTLMETGSSDAEVVEFLVDRYGDFVRYRPPFKASTLLLWSGPPVLMTVGLALLLVTIRRRQTLVQIAPLSEKERSRVARLLEEADETERRR